MFSTLFSSIRVEVAPGLDALVMSEPTVGVLRALGRAVTAAGGNLTPVEDAALCVALMVTAWEGAGAPGADAWPPLSPEGVATRLATVDALPRGVLVRLGQECGAALRLSAADSD